MSTLCRIRCTARFDGLEIGPSHTEYFARGPLTRRAVAPAPVAPPPPRPRKPTKPTPPRAPSPRIDDGHARVLLPPTAAAKRHPSPKLVLVPSKARQLRGELAGLRGVAGVEAARRRAQIKRQLEQLASKENHR